MMLAVGLSYMASIMLKYVPSIPNLVESFYYERMLNFVAAFYASIEKTMIFIFYFINVVYHIH